MARKTNATDAAIKELRAFGLAYPGAHTKSPWPGHLDLAVNDKTFAYLGVEGDPFHISCKLPHSAEEALSLPFVTPAAYGLGKSGWVNAQLPDGPIPIELFQAWIDESYRAQAPKRLLASLPETFGGAAGTGRALAPPTPKPVKKSRATPPLEKRPVEKKATAKTRARARVKKNPAREQPAAKRAGKARVAKKNSAKAVAKRRSAAKH